jgi:hypothetical protein
MRAHLPRPRLRLSLQAAWCRLVGHEAGGILARGAAYFNHKEIWELI